MPATFISNRSLKRASLRRRTCRPRAANSAIWTTMATQVSSHGHPIKLGSRICGSNRRKVWATNQTDYYQDIDITERVKNPPPNSTTESDPSFFINGQETIHIVSKLSSFSNSSFSRCLSRLSNFFIQISFKYCRTIFLVRRKTTALFSGSYINSVFNRTTRKTWLVTLAAASTVKQLVGSLLLPRTSDRTNGISNESSRKSQARLPSK